MRRIRTAMSGLAFGFIFAGVTCGIADAQEPPNGDFEAGVLDPWQGSGDVGVSLDNVLAGVYSGFLTTGLNAVGEVCSHLISPFVSPPTDRARARVRFKVRYKTNESTGVFSFFEDPFHAELVTAQGAVDLLTIKTDGIFWTRGDPTRTRVRDEAAGQELPQPPQIPPFQVVAGLFASETPPLSSRSEIRLKGCEPVRIKFQICDWFDSIVDSAAYIDDVTISFHEHGDHCPNTAAGPGILGGVEEWPAPRE